MTHNESRDAERLVPSLFAQSFRDLAISAVDNASEDGTRATLAAFEKVAPVPLDVFPSRENLGYTGGHNRSIAKAVESGIPWVLVLNTDVVLAPGFIATLLADAERPEHARVAAFTGKILRADGPDLAPTAVIDSVGIRMTSNGRHFDVGAGERDDGRLRPARRDLRRLRLRRRCSAPRPSRTRGSRPASSTTTSSSTARTSTSRGACAAAAGRRAASRPRSRGTGAGTSRSAGARCPLLANLHSVKNRFLLRINNAGRGHLRATFLRTFLRDAVVVAGCLTVERTSLEALRWLAQNRARLLAKRAEIQGRRTVPDPDLARWFTDDPRGARVEG